MDTSKDILFKKLDQFISKYYKNLMIRGVILSALLIIIYLVSISVLEYFTYFSILTRSILFYTSLVLIVAVLFFFVLVPCFKLFRVGKVLDYKTASLIISSHFSDLQDKLYNTLELIETSRNDSNSLLIASIEQRISTLRPIPFSFAINFRQNLKYLKYFTILFVLVSGILIFYPSVVTDGAQRIMKHDVYFEPKMPFTFELLNKSLNVEKGSDVDIDLKISGDYLPSSVELTYGGTSYFMKKISNLRFSYKMKNVNNSFNFTFSADDYSSKSFEIKVLSTPFLSSFKIVAEVPKYTGEKDFTIENIGDITVPFGTKLRWTFSTLNISDLKLTFDDDSISSHSSGNVFQIQRVAKKSSKYAIEASNPFIKNKSIIVYNLTIVPDLYPSIDVSSKTDSANNFMYYFNGTIKDDYGFDHLTFNYKVESSKSVKTYPVAINRSLVNQDFFYYINFAEFKAGDKLQYYFEVFDNDQINGLKSTKSQLFTFNIPTKEEVEKIEKKASADIESDMMKAMKLSKELKNDIESIQKKLLNQNTTEWEKTQLSQQLEQKHEQLMKLVENIKKENENKDNLLNNLNNEKNEQILEKQKEIQDLLNALMDDELKKMLDEYKKLMQEFEKNRFFEKSDDMKFSYEDLQKELDKNLELLKKYDVEKKVENTINKLNELKKDQDKLKDEVERGDLKKEDAAQKQEDLNKKLDDAKKDYNDALEKNSQLEKKMNLKKFDEEFKNLSNSMQQSSKEMKDGSKSKSQKKMKESSDQMQELANMMDQMMKMNQQKQNAEDEQALRQILDNLLTLSFEQETLIDDMKNVSYSDPKYIALSKKQLSVSEDFSLVKDSLFALSKRQPEISKPITEEISSISRNLLKVKDGFESRNSYTIQSNQQSVMSSFNNLALLLSEVLQSMQQQSNSNQQSSSDKQCKNPKKGKGSPSMSEMKSQQQSMKNQLQQMLDQLKSGQKSNQMGKQMSQMLSQQEKYQQMLNQLMKDGGITPEGTQKLNEIKQMIDQNKKDLINKSINSKLINRQDQILTRLLEAENAEKKRDTDTKRESKTSSEMKNSNPKDILKYKEKKNGSEELLLFENVKLNNYFKKMYDNYLININIKN